MSEAGSRCLDRLKAFFTDRSTVLDWGVAAVGPSPRSDRLRAWVGKGYHGDMDYMARRLEERANPRTFHPWAESAVMFSVPYGAPLLSSPGPYRVAAYALGDDYHDRARALLREAESWLREDPALADLRFYGFVDTAPVFERDLASEAGLGWRGKNGCTLSRAHGSAFHLCGFFLDVAMPASNPVQDFCGGCTRCIDLCPTDAFEGPGVLNATRCISYWTIENKSDIPEDLSKDFGGWIFGCDVCQEVCPWNHKHLASPGRAMEIPAAAGGKAAAPGGQTPALPAAALPEDANAWLALLKQGGGFQSRFKGSPFTRAGRRSLLRNLAVAIRNLGDTQAGERLAEVLAGESDGRLRREIERTLSALALRSGDRQTPAAQGPVELAGGPMPPEDSA